MKTMKKVALAAILVLLALLFVTCVEGLPETGGEDPGDYTDVIYDYVGSGDNIRVKSVTVYLDGTKVRAPAGQRALGLEAARLSHNFFEAIFLTGTYASNVVTPTSVARASWKIGQPAGISGVNRNLTTTGTDFGNVDPAAITSSLGAATVFVGKDSNKTLLAVGWLTHVEGVAGTTVIDSNTTNVTFTVAPLITWLGYDKGKSDKDVRLGTDRDPALTEAFATFITAAAATRAVGNGTDPGPTPWPATHYRYSAATATNTLGMIITAKGVPFPMFSMPSAKTLTADAQRAIIEATYTIGGLSAIGAPATGGSAPTGGTLWPAVRVYKPTGAVGLEVRRREPEFTLGGVSYGLDASLDKITQVDVATAANFSSSPYTEADGGMFDNSLDLLVTVAPRSGGAVAFTFQAPVYAINATAATNGGPDFTKWFVRPADGYDQYLLDDGDLGSGGTVLLGTDVSSLDWIIIKTAGGLGWNNE